MKTQHTPAPWKTNGNDIWLDGQSRSFKVASATVSSSALNGIDANANAAFIVRAVNSHDDLLIAAREAALELRAWRCEEATENNTSPSWESEAEKLLEKAIAKAEGES